MRSISIIHPSRNRPKQALKTIEHWLSRADSPVEYLLCLDLDDPTLKQYKKHKKVKILTNSNKSAIAAINYGAYYSTGDILVVVSDDFDAPYHWDTLLRNEVEGLEDFALKTQDGIQDFIITLPICDRIYYSRTKEIYPSVYDHLFSDSEWSCVAWMLGRYRKSDLLFPHNHHSIGKSKRDSLNVRNDRTWKKGEKTFYDRKKTNFGLPAEAIVNSFPAFAGFKKNV